jgi:hydroxyacylglutathione hydrolase
MILRRIFDPKLAQAAYLLGCSRTKQAIVVDPNRDTAACLRAAQEEGVKIVAVTETHIHADFVSGSRDLARAAGATLHLSDEGGEGWRYTDADRTGARLLKDGDTIEIGDLLVRALHTPGHTPEHLVFLVTETSVASEPVGACTGDFVFVGDVGRPDLLEKAAGVAGTMEAGARQLYASLRRFASQPDHLQLWPGHGAGSACGKALGAMPQTTLGYERRTNWALQPMDEATFVARVLEGQPAPPTYFARMKSINRDGPPPAPRLDAPREIAVADALAMRDAGAMLLDLRPVAAFGAGHLGGAVGIPMNKSFATWAGWLVPADRDVVLVGDEAAAREAVHDLALIGVDRVTARVAPAAVEAHGRAHGPLATTPSMPITDVDGRLGDPSIYVVDVRNPAEWSAGHLPGVPNIPLGELAGRMHELPADRTLVVHCQGGTRSAIAASVLEAHGRAGAVNLEGGFASWMAAGKPVER